MEESRNGGRITLNLNEIRTIDSLDIFDMRIEAGDPKFEDGKNFSFFKNFKLFQKNFVLFSKKIYEFQP